MSIAEEIAPNLRYLRRFARALAGNQRSGDAYVAAVLETLIADPSTFRRDLEPRVALFRQFLRIWNSMNARAVQQAEPGADAEAAVRRTLEAVTPRPRQAFLLMSVEHFTPQQTAVILDTDVKEVTRLDTKTCR